jgi:hypothetical protein
MEDTINVQADCVRRRKIYIYYQLANQSMGLIGRIEIKPIGVRYES